LLTSDARRERDRGPGRRILANVETVTFDKGLLAFKPTWILERSA
jgi:hypothetical protein